MALAVLLLRFASRVGGETPARDFHIRHRMLTRIGNFILAGLFFAGVVWPDNWRFAWQPALPPAPAGPVPTWAVLFASVVVLWFIASLCLLFRRRIGWLPSLIGVGLAVVTFAWVFMEVCHECNFPNPQELQDRKRLIGGMASVVIIYTMFFTFLSIYFSAAVGLFIGLLKLRPKNRPEQFAD